MLSQAPSQMIPPSFSGVYLSAVPMLLIQAFSLSPPAESLKQALCCPLVAPAVKELPSRKGGDKDLPGTLRTGIVGEEI